MNSAPLMPRHFGLPYYHGNPRLTSKSFSAEETANELRYIAHLMPDDAPDAIRRRAALNERAAQICAGQFVPDRHFNVFVPCVGYTPKGKRKPEPVKFISYPGSDQPLYTFDGAWILMEVFAAKRGWEDGSQWEPWAEGNGQNLTLGLIYDGIADPMRAVEIA